MAVEVRRSMDFLGSSRIQNLPNAVSAQEPATLAQLNSAVEGLASKDNARVSTQGNISILSPGASIDGIAMVSGDRVLVRAQTTTSENGIYIWNGASVAMTRSPDANTFDKLESAIIPIDEGSDSGTTWRQTSINGTLNTTAVTFVPFGTSTPNATSSSPGKVQLATQAEVNAGIDASKVVTPATLAASPFAASKFVSVIGDASATSYIVTHNLNTRDVRVELIRNSGNYDTVLAEVQRTSLNAVTIVFDAAIPLNSIRVLIIA